MNDIQGDRDGQLENFAAELTEVAYRPVLRRGVVDKWLDLELELWEALMETFNKWDQEWPQAGVMLVESDSAAGLAEECQRRTPPVRI